MSNPRVTLPPSPKAQPPSRPQNAAHEVSNAIGSVLSVPQRGVDMLNTGFAQATNFIAQALPCFPAATLTSMALGAPHAHTLHPPSGPPPVPPTPLPPFGPIMFGTCVSVLINGKPAARCGDLGLGPTCCGIPPIYEIFTGSSKVFIGGARAARQLDITYHCKPVPPAGAAARGAAAALQAAMKAAMIAGMAAQAAAVVGDAIEADNPANSPAMAAAMGMSATVGAAQMANDLIALAMGALMGKDVCVPPGTPGAITVNTSPTVHIGGFPMPTWMAIAKGLLKLVKGMKGRKGRGRKKANENPCGSEAQPINLMTGAFFEYFVDYELRGPIPFVLRRYYDSRWCRTDGPFGFGFRHEYQYTLSHTLEGLDLVTPDDETVSFPPLKPGQEEVARDGLVLRGLNAHGRYTVEEVGRPTMEFQIPPDGKAAPLRALRQGKNWMEFRHDAEGNLIEITDSAGRLLRFRHDRNHIVQIRCRKPGEKEVVLASYDYDRSGFLVRHTDALGHSSRYEYDANGRMVKRTNRRGYRFFNDYDEEGRCTREYGEDGLWDARARYMPAARCTVCTYADGATTTVFYDETGALTEVIEPSGGKTTFEFDEEGNIVGETDPLGNVTAWLYNAWGGHTARRDPLGHVLPRLDVDPNPADPLAYVLPDTPLEWEHGKLLAAEAIGVPSLDDPLLTSTQAPVYNAVLSLRERMLDRGTQPRQVFDPMGRLVEAVDERGHARRWKYDPEGNLIEHQDRDGSVHRYEYASWNLLHREISPTGAVTTYDYSLRSEVTRVTDPNGTASEYAYDLWDRLIEVRRGGQVRERYHYDLADNLIARTDGAGRPLLTLDIVPGNLRGARILAANGTTPGEEQRFEYDEAGRITLAATEKLEVARAHDARGRLIRDHRDGAGVDHAFAGRHLAATTVLGAFQFRYERPEPGTVKITDPTGSVHHFRISKGGLLERNLSSGRRELTIYSGDGQCLFKAGTNRWNQIDWRTAYVYSAEGDLLEVDTLAGDSIRYEHDEAHRLRREKFVGGQVREFVQDPANNLVAQPGLRDVELGEANRLASANGETFAYNERNHVSKRQGPGRSIGYQYDALDRLVACDVGGERWGAEYDPFCRRVSKTWRGRTTGYYWDGFRLAAEERADGTLRLYGYADESALVPFMFVEYASREADPASGKCYFLFTNQVGAPVRVEDDQCRVVWQARLDPYGRAHVMPGSEVAMPLRFPGHYHDEEIGLHCNGFRYYDPVLGRYIQSDPIGLMGGLNVYAYPANPLTGVDLDGLARHEPRRSRKNKPKPGKNTRPAQTDSEAVDTPTRRAEGEDQPTGRQVDPSGEFVLVQRVEAKESRQGGRDTNRRIAHNPETGQVTILPARKKRDPALHVSFDNPQRMEDFRNKRDGQRPDACVTRSFEVPRSEVDKITAGSRPQGPGTSALPGQPLEVDQPHAGQFALHPDDADRLAAAARPGSFSEE